MVVSGGGLRPSALSRAAMLQTRAVEAAQHPANSKSRRFVCIGASSKSPLPGCPAKTMRTYASVQGAPLHKARLARWERNALAPIKNTKDGTLKKHQGRATINSLCAFIRRNTSQIGKLREIKKGSGDLPISDSGLPRLKATLLNMPIMFVGLAHRLQVSSLGRRFLSRRGCGESPRKVSVGSFAPFRHEADHSRSSLDCVEKVLFG